MVLFACLKRGVGQGKIEKKTIAFENAALKRQVKLPCSFSHFFKNWSGFGKIVQEKMREAGVEPANPFGNRS